TPDNLAGALQAFAGQFGTDASESDADQAGPLVGQDPGSLTDVTQAINDVLQPEKAPESDLDSANGIERFLNRERDPPIAPTPARVTIEPGAVLCKFTFARKGLSRTVPLNFSVGPDGSLLHATGTAANILLTIDVSGIVDLGFSTTGTGPLLDRVFLRSD